MALCLKSLLFQTLIFDTTTHKWQVKRFWNSQERDWIYPWRPRTHSNAINSLDSDSHTEKDSCQWPFFLTHFNRSSVWKNKKGGITCIETIASLMTFRLTTSLCPYLQVNIFAVIPWFVHQYLWKWPKSRYYNSLKEIFFEELSMEKTLWPKRSWFDFLLSIEHWQWLPTCLSCQVGFSIRKCCHRHLFRESDWSSWNKRENMSSIDSSSCSRRRKNLQLLLPHILRSFLSDWVPLFRWATNWPERELNGQFEVKAV